MQIMRTNALRMPENVNVILSLASLESKAGNDVKAFARAWHALTLGSMMDTSIAAFASVALRTGQPMLTPMALQPL
jgi:hypothetical protein